MANLASFFILCIYLYGRSLHATRLKWHIRLMLTAFVADLILIAALVCGREALSKVHLDMPLALQIHVPIAVTTVVLYVFTVWTGYRLYRGDPVRARMRLLDRGLTSFRVLTLITSIWVQFAGG